MISRDDLPETPDWTPSARPSPFADSGTYEVPLPEHLVLGEN